MEHLVHAHLFGPDEFDGRTIGILCWNFYVTRILAYSWKHDLMKKIWGESHFLVIAHWTSYATKNEIVFEEKAHPLLLSQACQPRLGMTKRMREGSITIDDYDSQPLEVARQPGTRLSTIRIDHFKHDAFVCNLPLDDLVIDSGAQPHAMVLDSRRIFPRSVLQADTIVVSCGLANFECTSWSTQCCHKYWGLRDELATAANHDKFLESSEDNDPE